MVPLDWNRDTKEFLNDDVFTWLVCDVKLRKESETILWKISYKNFVVYLKHTYIEIFAICLVQLYRYTFVTSRWCIIKKLISIETLDKDAR